MNSENSGRSMFWMKIINTMKKGFFIIIIFYSPDCFFANENDSGQYFFQYCNNNPQLKMYDAQIRSQDAAAAGARNWEAPATEHRLLDDAL